MARKNHERYCMLCSVGTSAGMTNLVPGEDGEKWDEQKRAAFEAMKKFAGLSEEEREQCGFPWELQALYGYEAFRENGEWPEKGTIKSPRSRETFINFMENPLVLSSSDSVKEYIAGGFPSAETNSAIRWIIDKISHYEDGQVPFSCEIHLFPGEEFEPQFTAWVTKTWVEAAGRIGLFGPWKKEITVEVHDPISFEVTTPETMHWGVSALFESFDAVRKEAESQGKKVLINATGGYKVISGFSLLYAQVHAIPCLYIYETNNQVLELQALPLGFAVGALDEEIGFLKGLQTLLEKDLLQGDMFEKLPPWVQGLLLKKEIPEGGKESYEVSSLATTLIDHFEQNRRKNTGVGRRLLDMLQEKDTQNSSQGEQFRKYLEERIKDEWGELWMGDQIPETVEHSRRHSKRLMEIGGHLLENSRDILEKEGLLEPLPLALLISSIYLHDIGHTALGFPVHVDARSASSEEGSFPLGMFPTMVREAHHLLSRDLIHSKEEELFPEKTESHLSPEMVKILRDLVPQITAYHRGYTRLTSLDGTHTQKYAQELCEKKPSIVETLKLLYGEQGFEDSLRPLEEILQEKGLLRGSQGDWGISLEQVLGVTGLLRFIDGCDVQADRVVDEAYLKARLERVRYEAQMLEKQLYPLRALLEDMPGYENEQKSLWTFLHDLGKISKDIDFRQAKEGSIPEDIEKIVKEATRNIYPPIIRELQRMKNSSGEANFSSLFFAKDYHNAALLLALSLANRIAFKWEQFLHFHKHWGVKSVLPCKKDGKALVLLQGDGDLEGVAEDMREELQKVHDFYVLKNLDISIM